MQRRPNKKSVYERKTFSFITKDGLAAYNFLKDKINLSEMVENYFIYKATAISSKKVKIDNRLLNEKKRQFILGQLKSKNKTLGQITKQANELLKQENFTRSA